MYCRMNRVECRYADMNGYCDSTACHNMNVVGNIIPKERPENIGDSSIWVKPHGNWHTGTPTEEGWYLVAYECVYDCKNKGKIEYFTLNIITDEDGYKDYRGRASDDVWKAVAWQKIEPYKEKNNG